MRLRSPRIAPLSDAELTAEQHEAVTTLVRDGRPLLNIYRTLVRAPRALGAFLAWGSYILSKKNELPARQREIVHSLKIREESVKSVSQRLGMSESAVKVAAHRGYRTLRRLLGGRNEN